MAQGNPENRMSVQPPPEHWSRRPERGASLPMRLTAWAARTLGRRLIAPLVCLIVLYFYLTSKASRQAIGQYQQRLSRHAERTDLFPKRHAIYRQYLAFAESLLDKIDAWQGKITMDQLDLSDPDGLRTQIGQGRGQIFVCSHLGNMELCRAMAMQTPGLRLNVLVHSKNAVLFNQVLNHAGANALNLIQVSELDPQIMLDLNNKLARGEWLAIAGDRTPLHGRRVTSVQFLGAAAHLPQGPWLLAGLLRCPINTLFCTRRQGRFHVAMRRLSAEVNWTRATRDSEVARHAQRYADALAGACIEAPLQWFNFYPFWASNA